MDTNKRRLEEHWREWREAMRHFEASMADVKTWPDLATLKPKPPLDVESIGLFQEIAGLREETLATLKQTLRTLISWHEQLMNAETLWEALDRDNMEIAELKNKEATLIRQIARNRHLGVSIVGISKPKREKEGIVTITGRDFAKIRRGEKVTKAVELWSDVADGALNVSFPEPTPMDRFWVYVKGLYDQHKGQLEYDYASRLTVAALTQLPAGFKVPDRPSWWKYPG